MTAPQQKDLLTQRWRQVRAPDPKESQIQISLVAQLRFRCRKDVVYFHVPNGEERTDKIGAKLKAMGVLRGVSDLLFVWCDPDDTLKPPATHKLKMLFLELKRRGTEPTPEQYAFCEATRACGAFYDWADTIDGAINILKGYGLLAR